jgi:hypothetical protein
LLSSCDSCFRILAKTIQLYTIRTFRRVLVLAPALLTAFREEGVWDLIFSEDCFYFGSSAEDIQFHIVTENQNDSVRNNKIATDSESSYRTDVNILHVEAISFLEFAATLNENTYNLVTLFLFCGLISILLFFISNDDIFSIFSFFFLKAFYFIFLLFFVARMLSTTRCT